MMTFQPPLLISVLCRTLHTYARRRLSISTSGPVGRVVSRPDVRIPVTLIQGDGVYPEILDAVQTVLHSTGAPIDCESFFLSDIHPDSSANLREVIESVRRNSICLRGTIGTPDFSRSGALDSLAMRFRKELDLFANVVWIQSLPGVRTRHTNVDMVIIREQIEGEYSALEHESVPGVVECLKIVTEQRSRRIAKFAFDYATKHGRSKVTAVHKANIMKLGDGLFLRCCQEVSHLYPAIKFDHMIVDNCTMQLVSNPHQFDVMVMPNLYGEILTNLGSGIVGGAGVACGESYSSDVVCFEPACRHTYSRAAGRNVANPTAMLLSAANMLDHLDLHSYGKMVRDSVQRVLKAGKVKTKDIGGHATTKQFVATVINNCR